MKFPQKFYKATHTYNSYEKHVNAPYLRADLRFEEGKKYVLTVSGLGFYKLFFNGKEITKGLLAPYISSPDDIVYFDRYDMTGLIDYSGDNTVALLLGNGMQNAPGGRVWEFDSARFRGAPRFAMMLTETDEQGNETRQDIGARFKTAPSPILFDDLRSGCFYDANLEQAGWNLPGFDDSDWQPVLPAEAPRGERRLCDADPILVRETRKAIEIREAAMDPRLNNRSNMRLDTQFKFDILGKTGVMFDFGVNTAGICRLTLDGKKGQKIFIQFCEMLTTDGKPSYQNTGSFYPDNYGQTAYYVCKGEKGETFEPSFCYFGYRYAVVYGLEPQQISEDTLVMLVANSDLKERGAFTCSDNVMNRLGEMARVSDLANFWYFPTDCPHREKNGWTGDAACSAEHMLLTLTPERSYREWLRNICKAQNDLGQLPGIVPTGGWGFEWGNGPAWDNVLSELCWQIWRMRGDLTPAKECKDSLMRYVAYLAANREKNGLINFGLGDWLQPGKGAGDPVAPVRLTSSVIAMYIANKTADLFDALGYALHRDFARGLARELRKAIRENLIDFGTMTVLPRCQTAQAICLYYGVFDESERARAGEVLLDIIHETDDHVDSGMIGMRVLFHALSMIGQGELAYKMITRTDYPSYGMFVRRNLTSLPEDFMEDKDHDYANSLNHHFFGDIVSWFMQKVVGIRVNPRGISPNQIDVTPDFLDALASAEGYYLAPAGKISVAWTKADASATLTIDTPDGVTGDIRLPAGWVFVDEKHPRSSLNNSNFIELREGTYLCRRIG
ncbi:MAG: family 78 glycoside hydrolase catalytic domain [Clostridia bacterium]|nr:family 78 glycoside hydrolase catalytic domain [Clostridia bacterium]